MHGLEPIGDHAPFDEIDEAVREHLGVNAQVMLSGQPSKHGIGDRANPHLERGAVFDKPRDNLANASLNWCFTPARVLVRGAAGTDEGMHAIDGNRRRTMRSRHAVVDLGNDEPGIVDGRACGVD